MIEKSERIIMNVYVFGGMNFILNFKPTARSKQADRQVLQVPRTSKHRGLRELFVCARKGRLAEVQKNAKKRYSGNVIF